MNIKNTILSKLLISITYPRKCIRWKTTFFFFVKNSAFFIRSFTKNCVMSNIDHLRGTKLLFWPGSNVSLWSYQHHSRNQPAKNENLVEIQKGDQKWLNMVGLVFKLKTFLAQVLDKKSWVQSNWTQWNFKTFSWKTFYDHSNGNIIHKENWNLLKKLGRSKKVQQFFVKV